MNDTKLALQVLSAIERHSIQNPITGAALAELFGITRRHVQLIVEELRDSGRKVGSAMGTPSGYFLAAGPEQLQETAEHYRSRGRLFFATANKLLNFGRLQQTIWEQEVTE
jgi:biotin operon repressor